MIVENTTGDEQTLMGVMFYPFEVKEIVEEEDKAFALPEWAKESKDPLPVKKAPTKPAKAEAKK